MAASSLADELGVCRQHPDGAPRVVDGQRPSDRVVRDSPDKPAMATTPDGGRESRDELLQECRRGLQVPRRRVPGRRRASGSRARIAGLWDHAAHRIQPARCRDHRAHGRAQHRGDRGRDGYDAGRAHVDGGRHCRQVLARRIQRRCRACEGAGQGQGTGDDDPQDGAADQAALHRLQAARGREGRAAGRLPRSEVMMATTTLQHYPLRIGGEIVDTAEVYEIVNPATEEVFATVAKGGIDHTDRAVAAAKAAHARGDWRAKTPDERADVLDAICARMSEQMEDLCALEIAENGATIRQVMAFHIGYSISHLQYFADLCRQYPFEQSGPSLTYPTLAVGRVRRE